MTDERLLASLLAAVEGSPDDVPLRLHATSASTGCARCTCPGWASTATPREPRTPR